MNPFLFYKTYRHMYDHKQPSSVPATMWTIATHESQRLQVFCLHPQDVNGVVLMLAVMEKILLCPQKSQG